MAHFPPRTRPTRARLGKLDAQQPHAHRILTGRLNDAVSQPARTPGWTPPPTNTARETMAPQFAAHEHHPPLREASGGPLEEAHATVPALRTIYRNGSAVRP